MTRESASGSRTPEGPDAFSPTSQLATFADDESRWNNVIIVNDATARNALTSPILRDDIIAIQRDDDSVWLCTSAVGPTWRRVLDDSGWINPALLNGWANLGAGYVAARYRRLNGVVHVQATLTGGTVTTGTPFFQLPAGFRPSATLRASATLGSGATGAIEIRATGDVVAASIPGSTTVALLFAFPWDA